MKNRNDADKVAMQKCNVNSSKREPLSELVQIEINANYLSPRGDFRNETKTIDLELSSLLISDRI